MCNISNRFFPRKTNCTQPLVAWSHVFAPLMQEAYRGLKGYIQVLLPCTRKNMIHLQDVAGDVARLPNEARIGNI